MGAVKQFLHDAAEAGRCPISPETWDYLDDIECRHQIDWIGYTEHDYVGRDGRLYVEDCITMESARRLVAEGMANDEIIAFVECFGDCCPEVVPAVTPSRQESAGVRQSDCRHEWAFSPLAGYEHWCQRCLIPGRKAT